jgi:hypothetical protein
MTAFIKTGRVWLNTIGGSDEDIIGDLEELKMCVE